MELVPFAESFADSTFRWMQDDAIRAALLIQRTITAEAHQRWCKAVRDDPSQLIWAAVADGVHVGNFGYREVDHANRRGLLWMYLGSEHRRCGHGRTMLAAGIDKARVHGFRKIHLHVRSDNVPAIHAYAERGFEVEGMLRRHFLYDGRAIDVLLMSLFLDC